jgi:hypothetical protein
MEGSEVFRNVHPNFEILESESRVTLQLAVYRQSVRLGFKPFETHDQYLFQLNTSGYSPYVTFSLTRGWVCRLQLLLALASAVILGSESRGTHEHILLSQIRGPGPHICIPQEQGGPFMPPGTGFLFVASYDSHGYGGGIRTRLHTGY